jgi:hypothetical protein
MNEKINEQQLQQLSNSIADVCEQMALTPEQILDGLARTLISATATFDTRNLKVSITNFGYCEVKLYEQEDDTEQKLQ